jgi:hypothetical protein
MATLAIAISEEVLTNGKLMDKRSGRMTAHSQVFVASRQKTKVFANGGSCGAKDAAASLLSNLFGGSPIAPTRTNGDGLEQKRRRTPQRPVPIAVSESEVATAVRAI